MAEVTAYSWDFAPLKLDTDKTQGSEQEAEPVLEEDVASGGLKHVGILVFDKLWEFSPRNGLVTAKFRKEKKITSAFTPSAGSPVIQNLGTTVVTEKDFKEWKDKSIERFKLEDYDTVTKNGIHWATEAAAFLGVESPANWKEALEWICRNEEAAKLEFETVISAFDNEPEVKMKKVGKTEKCAVV